MIYLPSSLSTIHRPSITLPLSILSSTLALAFFLPLSLSPSPHSVSFSCSFPLVFSSLLPFHPPNGDVETSRVLFMSAYLQTYMYVLVLNGVICWERHVWMRHACIVQAIELKIYLIASIIVNVKLEIWWAHHSLRKSWTLLRYVEFNRCHVTYTLLRAAR